MHDLSNRSTFWGSPDRVRSYGKARLYDAGKEWKINSVEVDITMFVIRTGGKCTIIAYQ